MDSSKKISPQKATLSNLAHLIRDNSLELANIYDTSYFSPLEVLMDMI